MFDFTSPKTPRGTKGVIYLMKSKLYDICTTELFPVYAGYRNFKTCMRGFNNIKPELCFCGTVDVMCCFEDGISDLEDKVDDRERGEEMSHP